jgi:glycosyltransferase involved in cell wall biosynthesis
MEKVLIIAYQFPPMGGSGVQRTAKFVKYLRNYGWEPVVLTRKTGKRTLLDESLLKEIPDDIKIIRTSSFDLTEIPVPFNIPGKIIARKILIPDAELLWKRNAIKKAIKILKKEKINTVYTTSYPYSDHMLGLYIKKRFEEVHWVADFRDEWTNNPYLIDNPHYKMRMKIEEKMEEKVLKKADVLITNTPFMKDNFIKNNKKLNLKNRFHVIPNGFDEEDFKGMEQTNLQNKKFTITHTGSLYGRRKPDIFFAALRDLIEKKEVEKDKIEVILIGNLKTAALKNLSLEYSLSDIVSIKDYMPHKECLVSLMNSDALLLLEGAGPGAEAFYTGKIFEYINTGRPILAVIPENGAAASIIKKTGTGIISDSLDTLKTSENILKLYKSWEKGEEIISPVRKEIIKFERKKLTEQLAELLKMQ